MRNEKRLEAPQNVESTPANDSTFSFVSPTEIIELPSKGKFYSPNHPLHNKTEVEIRNMTAKEEDLLTNESLIKSGQVINKLLASVLVDKNIDVATLLIADRNSILFHTRKISYGEYYDVQVQCAECNKDFQQTFNLDACIHIDEGTQADDVVNTLNGTFVMQMPQTDAKIEFRLLTSADEDKLIKSQLKDKTVNINAFILNSSIVRVNDTEQHVEAYIDQAPIAEVHLLRDAILKCTPTTKMLGTIECIYCEDEREVELPLGLSFFRLNS